jgi:hypothetical protein
MSPILDTVKNIGLGVLPTALGLFAFGMATQRKQSPLVSALIGSVGVLAGETAKTYLSTAGTPGATMGLTLERVGYLNPYSGRRVRSMPGHVRVSGLALERVGACGAYGCY